MNPMSVLDTESIMGADGTSIAIDHYGARHYFTRWNLTGPTPRRVCTRCPNSVTHRVDYAAYELGDLTCATCADHLQDVLSLRVTTVRPLRR